MATSRPRKKKRSTFFDAQVSMQERLTAYQALSPATKEVLKKANHKPGQVPTMAQMDALLNAAEERVLRNLAKTCSNALLRRDLASVNAVLGAVGQGEALGLDPEEKLMDIATSVIHLILQELELKAYQRFRGKPTSDNYARCWATRNALDTLSIDQGTRYPVNPWPKCIVRPPLKPGPYTVVKGDWLSKIAERYYGAANLWDAIFESNNYDGHPDRTIPGTSLMIYEGR